MVTILQDAPRKKSFLEKLSQGVSSGITSGLDTAMQLRGEKSKSISAIPKAFSRGVKQYKSLALEDPSEAINFQKTMRQLVDEGYSPDDAFLLAYNNYSKQSEGEPSASKQGGFGTEVGHGFAKGFRPFARTADIPGGFLELLKGATQEATGADKLPERIREAQAGPFGGFIPSVTEFYDKLTGGAGKPTNAVERAIEGFPLGPAGVAGSYAGETLKSAGLPESVQNAGDFVAFMLTHRYMPKGTPKLSSGAKEVMSRAEKVAASTGESVDVVLEKAAAESGVNFKAVLAGDAEAAKALDQSISRQVKAVSGLEFKPFEPGKETARREKTAESLKEAPLQEYYDIEERAREKESKRSPEKVAEEKARAAELEPKEKALIDEHHKIREELRTKKSPALKRELSRIEKQLSDLRYEKRHGRPPPTDAEVSKQIESSRETLRSEANNPTPEGQEKIARDLKNDEKYLEHMEKVSEKGPISQEFNPDTYIKMNEKYLNAYKDAILKEEQLMKEMSSEAKLRSKRFVDYLQGRVKGLQAKIVRQAEKIKAIKALENPSGAFYKNMIKQTRSDLKQFKKDLFTHRKRVVGIEDAKARTVAKKAIAERNKPNPKVEEAAKESVKNPSKENINKTAKESGVEPEKIETLQEELDSIFEKEEPVTERQIGKFERWAKKAAWAAGGSFAVGAGAEWLNQKIYDGKASTTKMQSIISGIAGIVALRGLTLGNQGKSWIRGLFEDDEAKKLKSLPVSQKDAYYRKIIKARGNASAKRIGAKMEELD